MAASPSPAALAPEPAVTLPRLVEIRAARHPGYDRIVFEFEGPPPERARARWARRLRLQPSGEDAHVQGNAFIKVRFAPALAHAPAASAPAAVPAGSDPSASPAPLAPSAPTPAPPEAASFGPERRAYDLPNIAHVALLRDTDERVVLGIGLMARTEIVRTTMLRDPSRYVVDVSNRYRKGRVTVFFADEDAIVAGRLPPVTAVRRTVPRGLRAEAALQRLYAGPTAGEQERGLRFIASMTTGFADLRVNRRGIARVTILGPCDSLGSAVITVADQIRATLKARPAIDWVKIYDEDGQTTFPWGRRDSIPGCLEP